MKRLLTLMAVVAFTLTSFVGCGSKEVVIEVDPEQSEAMEEQRQMMEQQMQQMMQVMPQPPQVPVDQQQQEQPAPAQ